MAKNETIPNFQGLRPFTIKYKHARKRDQLLISLPFFIEVIIYFKRWHSSCDKKDDFTVSKIGVDLSKGIREFNHFLGKTYRKGQRL